MPKGPKWYRTRNARQRISQVGPYGVSTITMERFLGVDDKGWEQYHTLINYAGRQTTVETENRCIKQAHKGVVQQVLRGEFDNLAA